MAVQDGCVCSAGTYERIRRHMCVSFGRRFTSPHPACTLLNSGRAGASERSARDRAGDSGPVLQPLDLETLEISATPTHPEPEQRGLSALWRVTLELCGGRRGTEPEKILHCHHHSELAASIDE